VLASEFNDFIKPLDEGTLNACLKALHGCHYYILFIGNRSGSWFDESNRISITRKEYQYAYQLHLEKKIHLILFVRSDVLNMFENRKILSNIPDDLYAVFQFIEEVRMPLKAQANAHDLTSVTGNWLHQFTTFRDIVDTLQALVFYGKSIDRKALESLLSRELRDLLKSNLIKEQKSVFSPKKIIKDFYSRVNIPKIEGPETSIKVNSTDWDSLWYYLIHIMKVDFVTPILQYALESNAFLTYHITENKFKENEIYNLLLRLSKEIKFFNSTKSDD
jgi:hypothetical protein